VTQRRLFRLGALCVVVVATSTGCAFIKERRLMGQWRTEKTPEQTLDLYEDHTYSLRLSGKTLGVLSEVFGPEKGSWHVEGDKLVLLSHNTEGVEETRRLAIDSIGRSEIVLAGDRWRRADGH
jgi:hypothetical protein